MNFSRRLFTFSKKDIFKSLVLRYVRLVVGQGRVLEKLHHSVISFNSFAFNFLYYPWLLQYLVFLSLSCSFYVQGKLVSLGQVGTVSQLGWQPAGFNCIFHLVLFFGPMFHLRLQKYLIILSPESFQCSVEIFLLVCPSVSPSNFIFFHSVIYCTTLF